MWFKILKGQQEWAEKKQVVESDLQKTKLERMDKTLKRMEEKQDKILEMLTKSKS
jgi:hypothetical protein